MEAARSSTADLFEHQARLCASLGSAMYEALLLRAAIDLREGGPVARAVEPFGSLPPEEVLGLRFLGAVHRLVLEGGAPQLEARYPSVGGDGDAEAAWPLVRALVDERLERVHELMDHTIQTNEVGRCAALAPGFLLVARETGLPLRIREMGASAGLLMRWDSYRYDAGDTSWGDPFAGVRFGLDVYEEPRPRLDGDVYVADRRGCDRSPIDPSTEEGRLLLLMYVWPDQTRRFEQLRAALKIAAATRVPVDEADASGWVSEQLAAPVPEHATVLYHSIVMQYLSEEEREAVRSTIAAAGERATSEAPLAWLRFEPGGEHAHVHLTTWPGGEERFLAEAGYHGRPVRWRG